MNSYDLLSEPRKDISVTTNRIAFYGISGLEGWTEKNEDSFNGILRDVLGASEDIEVKFFERPGFSGTRLTELITPMMKWLAHVENGGSKPDATESLLFVSKDVEAGGRDHKTFQRFAGQVGLSIRENMESDLSEDVNDEQVRLWIETGALTDAEELDAQIADLMGSSDDDDEDSPEESENAPQEPVRSNSSSTENDWTQGGNDPFSSFDDDDETDDDDGDPFAAFADDDTDEMSAVDQYNKSIGAADLNTHDDHEVTGNTVTSNIDDAESYLNNATGGNRSQGFVPQREEARDDSSVHNASTEMHSRPSEAGYDQNIHATTRIMAEYSTSPNSNERESRSRHPYLTTSNVYADSSGCVIGFSGTSGGVGKTALGVVSAKSLAANVDQYNENNRIPYEQRRDVYLLEMDFTNPDLAAREEISTEHTLETLALVIEKLGAASFTRHSNQSVAESDIIENAIDRITYEDEETGLKMIAAPYQLSVSRAMIQRAFLRVLEHLSARNAIIVIDMSNFDSTDPFIVSVIESFTTSLFVVAKPSGGVGEKELSRATKSLTSTQHTGKAQGLGLSTERVKIIVNKGSNEEAVDLRRFASGCDVIGHVPTFTEITTGRDQDIEKINASNMQSLQITLLTFIGRSLSSGKIPEIATIVQDYDPTGFVPKQDKVSIFTRIIQFFTR